ncbi:conjugal transfer protein TraR [Sphingomonas sp. BE137]|uniref:conjugal transfer protein TraR n=1 Tax=Sphingomonas sp. BE137 TaxID=2817844 RepID=UPI001AE3A325|nr:conjugal transfer protein TraR [Sphingomonas sp. BE137]MDR6847148.1 hypothetical protein [Sphingomonas sp. BE137]
MVDLVDAAQQLESEHLARAIAAARVPVPEGIPGECESCGEDMPRLVDGRCAPCRDGRVHVARFRPVAAEDAA